MDPRQFILAVSLDAEGEFWVTADPYPTAGGGSRPYGHAKDVQSLRILLMDDLRIPRDRAYRVVAEVQKFGRFTEIDSFAVDLRRQLQAAFDRQLEGWRSGSAPGEN